PPPIRQKLILVLLLLHKSPPPKTPRLYFVLTTLLICAAILILRDHRPSFLRPDLHMYAYASTADGALTVIDLVTLHSIAKIPVGPAISDLRENAFRDELWGCT